MLLELALRVRGIILLVLPMKNLHGQTWHRILELCSIMREQFDEKLGYRSYRQS